MSDAPLYEALCAYAQRDPLRLHMPGHVGKTPWNPNVLEALRKIDVTELPSTGDAFTGAGPVGEALDRADALYGGTTVFSAGGATLCLQAAMSLAARPGDTVVVDRRCHKAVLNALILLGLRPAFLYPSGCGAAATVTAERLANVADRAARKPVLAVLTSPTYYGLVCDLPRLIDAAHDRSIPVLVDNAHGAHFVCDRSLHPFFAGADYCVDSFHKTLPALTGAAVLHCRRPRKDALEAMRLFGSTSPSFPVLASIDCARALVEERGEELYQTACSRMRALRLAVALTTPFRFPHALSGCRFDPLRLTLDCRSTGLTPSEIAAHLSQNGCEVEMADSRYVVALFSLLHTEDDFRRFPLLLQALPFRRDQPLAAEEEEDFPRLRTAGIPRAAYFAPKRRVPLAGAAGRIAAEPLYFYPPGIPLCVPGERLSPEFCARYARHFDTIAVVR